MSTSGRLEMAVFERLLEVHGSRIERWPEASREQLGGLLESSPLARMRLEEAKRLDALLDALPDVEPAPELLARITSLPARHPRSQRARWWPFNSPLTPLFAWGTAAMLGVLLGVVAPDFAEPLDDESADMATLDVPAADDDGNDDWSDMSGLAMGADWASEDE
jgi:hypothetical protein